MDYFGDAEKLPQGCGRCDNCQTPEAAPVDDKTQETVRILLSGAARLGGRFGASQLADLVTGSESEQIRKHKHDQLPTYGRLSAMNKRQLQAMIVALIRQGYLRQEGLRYPVLSVTDSGREVMHDRMRARLRAWTPAIHKEKRRAPAARAAVAPAEETEGDSDLRAALRSWRARRAREMGVPPYTLFWDRTLDELCVLRPTTPAGLLTVWGIGRQKSEVFGAELLALIAAHRGDKIP
jgi:ATP-dependent DNA helicase RecQ